MKRIFGLICLMLAGIAAAIHRKLDSDLAGTSAIKLCCTAFFSGIGTDTSAVEVIKEMGPDGTRRLKRELLYPRHKQAATEMLKMLANDKRP